MLEKCKLKTSRDTCKIFLCSEFHCLVHVTLIVGVMKTDQCFHVQGFQFGVTNLISLCVFSSVAYSQILGQTGQVQLSVCQSVKHNIVNLQSFLLLCSFLSYCAWGGRLPHCQLEWPSVFSLLHLLLLPGNI